MGPGRYGVYSYSPRLIPWLKEHAQKYDVVVVNGLWQFQGFAAWCALRRKDSPPYCVFTHGMLDPWFKRQYPLKHLKKWLYWPWGEYRVLRDAHAVLFTTEEERILAKESFWLYRCREKVVNHGTQGPEGDPIKQRALFLETFPELRGKRAILFLGRIHVKKGCDTLIEAFHALVAKVGGSDLHLVMAGPADNDFGRRLKSDCERLGLASRVTWTGMVSGDLKWGAFHAAEAFILPSHQENFGISVAESMACGLPVLISNKVNIWREIEQDRAGIVERDDPSGTARLLERWLALSETERSAMRAAAKESFTQRFEIMTAAKKLLEALEEVTRMRGDPR